MLYRLRVCSVICDVSPNLSEDPQSSASQWIAVCCMHACRTLCFPITELSLAGWHTLVLTKLSALLAQETTKSHHYLDYIMGPPTHAACPRYWDVYTRQPDSWVGALWCYCLGQYCQKGVQVSEVGVSHLCASHKQVPSYCSENQASLVESLLRSSTSQVIWNSTAASTFKLLKRQWSLNFISNINC